MTLTQTLALTSSSPNPNAGSAPPTESLNVTLQPKDGLLLRLAPLGGKGGKGGEGATYS